MMKKIPNGGKVVLVTALCALVGVAQAATVSLGTIIHDYGSGAGQMAPASQGAGSCDVLNTNSVTVRSASGCQRFYDSFDFSTFGYDSIDRFELTLDFTGARNETFGFERWAPRPASSASGGSSQTATFLNASGPQSWVFDDSLDVWDDIVSSGSFYLWMSRELVAGVNSVNLNYARLEVFGTERTEPPEGTVSSPGSLALASLGIGLAFLGTPSLREKLRTHERNRRRRAFDALTKSSVASA